MNMYLLEKHATSSATFDGLLRRSLPTICWFNHLTNKVAFEQLYHIFFTFFNNYLLNDTEIIFRDIDND